MNNRNGNSRFVAWTWWASLVLVVICAAIALVLLLASCSMKGIERRVEQDQTVQAPVDIHASEGSDVTSINLTFLGQSAGWLCLPVIGFMFIRSRITLGALDRVISSIEEQGKNEVTEAIKQCVRIKGGGKDVLEGKGVWDYSENVINKRLRKNHEQC